jgi:hypothetical protein
MFVGKKNIFTNKHILLCHTNNKKNVVIMKKKFKFIIIINCFCSMILLMNHADSEGSEVSLKVICFSAAAIGAIGYGVFYLKKFSKKHTNNTSLKSDTGTNKKESEKLSLGRSEKVETEEPYELLLEKIYQNEKCQRRIKYKKLLKKINKDIENSLYKKIFEEIKTDKNIPKLKRHGALLEKIKDRNDVKEEFVKSLEEINEKNKIYEEYDELLAQLLQAIKLRDASKYEKRFQELLIQHKQRLEAVFKEPLNVKKLHDDIEYKDFIKNRVPVSLASEILLHAKQKILVYKVKKILSRYTKIIV